MRAAHLWPSLGLNVARSFIVGLLPCGVEGVKAPDDVGARPFDQGPVEDREASPVELAREMGEALPNVAYHVRELHKLGAVALVRQRQVRGAVEQTYTAILHISIQQKPLYS